MRLFAKLFMVAVGLTLLGLVVILVPHSDVNAQSPTQVQVVNTPLPISGVVAVRGGVTVTNTPLPVTVRGIAVGAPLPVVGNVSVANFPSTQPVSFSNTASTPLFVKGVDSGPFALSAECNFGNPPTPCEPAYPGQPNITLPSTTGSGAPISAVVIDFVSGYCGGLAASTIVDFHLQVFGPNYYSGSPVVGQSGAGHFHFPGVPQTGTSLNPFVAGTNISWFAQQTTIYALPGSSIVLLMGVNSGCELSVSGHLIPQ